MWNHCCGITVVESSLWNHCCETIAVESLLWNRCCGIIAVESPLWNHCCGIIDVESLLWNHCCGRHLGDIWETFGRHLGGIWEASGRHLGDIWEVSGRHLGAGAAMGGPGSSRSKMCSNPLCFTVFELATPCFTSTKREQVSEFLVKTDVNERTRRGQGRALISLAP